MRFGRIGPALIAAVTVPWLLTGCTLFGWPYSGGFDGEMPSPSIIATYSTGSATITLEDGSVITLDQVRPNATVDNMMGSNVRWTGPDGWSLALVGAGADQEMFGYEALQIDRIADGQHLSIFDSSGCDVDVERADDTGLEGNATCNGLEWYDALDQGGWIEEMPQPLDLPEWDAEITFEASP